MKKNPFEEVKTSVIEEKIEPKEIQKAEIFSALRNSNNPVYIKKTGKEIKNYISKASELLKNM